MKKIYLFILGLILIGISFIFSTLNIIRLMFLILGIFLIDIQVTKNYPKKIIFLMLLPIILLVTTYGIDILLVKYCHKIPIFSYEIVSSKKVKTYNSFFYRVFSCDNNLILDYGYTSNYACSLNDLQTHDVNAFLGETIASFHEYRHKFVKIQGKISKISGTNILELSPYSIDPKNTLNGYVEFNTSYIIRINTENDLSNLRIFDDITIIGLVNNLVEGENTIIDLINTVIVPSNVYDEYNLEIIENKEKELATYVEKNNIFLLGLSDIYVHYDENHIYELKYLITDKRLDMKQIIANTKAEKLTNEDKEEVGNIYDLEKFKVLVCQNKKIIIASHKNKITSNLCK